MSGYVRKKTLKSGKVRFYPVVIVGGKEHALGGFKLKKEGAQVALKEAEAQVAAGTFDKPEPPAPSTFAEFYLRWDKAKEKSLKVSTLTDYRSVFEHHILPFFAEKRLDQITPLIVQEWVNSLDTSPATTKKCYRIFHSCIQQAEVWGEIETNPCRGIILPRVSRRQLDFLEPEEIDALLQECEDPEAKMLLTLLAYSGLRLGEGLGLAWKHIDFEMGVIKVERSHSGFNGFCDPKTPSSRRAAPWMPSLSVILHDYYRQQGNPDPDALLFSEDGETPFVQTYVRRRFYAALKAAHLKHVNIHSLRHTFASVMIASGANIKALQRSLGHANAKETLDTYSHLIPETMDLTLVRADALMTGANGKVVQLPKRR